MIQDISKSNYQIIFQRVTAYIFDFILFSPIFVTLTIIAAQELSIYIFHAMSLTGFIIIFLFFTIFVFLYGQTPGKMLMNIIILNKDGNLPTLQQSMLRSAAYFLTSVPLLKIIDISSVILDTKRRSIRDFSAGTVVVSHNNITDKKTRQKILLIAALILFCDILLYQLFPVA
ncbi:RDD family protein [Rickettsiales bacterium]|nr:RDD family protein [Rickettsiales bacterium]MDB2550315.1 RDD family protein [Rickettsiales bacterium]